MCGPRGPHQWLSEDAVSSSCVSNVLLSERLISKAEDKTDLGYFLRFRRDLSFSGAVVLALLVTAGTRFRTAAGFFSSGGSEVSPSARCAGGGVRLARPRKKTLESPLLADCEVSLGSEESDERWPCFPIPIRILGLNRNTSPRRYRVKQRVRKQTYNNIGRFRDMDRV